MSQPPSSEPNQRINISDASIAGQVGQAGRDNIQIQAQGNVTFYTLDRQKEKEEKLLTRQEELNRHALLNKVRNYWIRSVLEQSLFNKRQIDLGLEKRLDAIDLVSEIPEHLRQPLARGTKAINIFDELGVGRTLLLLGEPGSGKTITLLEMARELIERAEKDVNLPIPVVLNLSSWAKAEKELVDWLLKEFETGIYKVSREISSAWIQNQQLLLLLDGLDEVREELRETCVGAINQFSQQYGQTEIIVCSRNKAYEALSQRLRFQSALFIQPLEFDQVAAYLAQAGEALSGVNIALQTDPVLQASVQTPLILSVMALAYQGMPASVFSHLTLEERRQHLWMKYIDRAYARKLGDTDYPRFQALKWLGYLAQRMIQESQTLFLIEQIKPSWLESSMQRRIYPLLVGLLAGLVIEWLYGLPLGLVGGMLSLQMLIGLLSGVALGVIGSLSSEITLFTTIGWSWSMHRAWKAALPGILSGPLIACLVWLCGNPLGLIAHSLQFYLMVGLLIGVAIAIISVIFAGLVTSKVDSGADLIQDSLMDTNQGVWQSANRAVVTTLLALVTIILPISLLSNLVIPFSAILGCISLYAGGMACVQHMTIRILLWQVGHSPLNYTDFLNDSTNRILLKKTGGSYQFVHDLLRKEIAFRYFQEKQSKPVRFKFNSIKLGLVGIVLACLSLSIALPLSINTGKVDAIDVRAFTPRLEEGDRLIIDRVSPHFLGFKRGDIVFIRPTDEMKQAGFGYPRDLKQILGLPGEQVKITKNNVYINGQLFQNSKFRVNPAFHSYPLPEKLPEHMYLVVVNNPNYYDPKDGFPIYCIPEDHIESRFVFRYWPFQKFGFVTW